MQYKLRTSCTFLNALHHLMIPYIPWSLDDAPAASIDAMCQGIIGFKLTIDSIQTQAQFKLSQNETAESITGMITNLERLNTSHATAMAVKLANHHNR